MGSAHRIEYYPRSVWLSPVPVDSGPYSRVYTGHQVQQPGWYISMKIGQIAKASGVRIDTLRYYEKEGLIKPASRTEAGYREYDNNAVQQMRFILKAKALGFSLQEIRELLSLRIDREHHPCSEVKDMAETKLTSIEEKIAELQRMHQALKRISDMCCGGPEPAVHCSILDALEQSS